MYIFVSIWRGKMLCLQTNMVICYRFNKKKHQNDWFRKAAEEIGVDIEDENLYPLNTVADGKT